jgi:signal transduction histidine kinase
MGAGDSFSLTLQDDGIGFNIVKMYSDKMRTPLSLDRFDSLGLGLRGLYERCRMVRCKMTIESEVGLVMLLITSVV